MKLKRLMFYKDNPFKLDLKRGKVLNKYEQKNVYKSKTKYKNQSQRRAGRNKIFRMPRCPHYSLLFPQL